MEMPAPIAFDHMLSYADARLLTLVLAVVLPALGYLRFRQFIARGEPVMSTRMKLGLYARIVSTQWMLVLAMLLILQHHSLTLADAGQRVGGALLTWSVTAGVLLILAIVAVLLIRRVRRTKPDSLGGSMGRLRRMVPRFGVELAAFAVVCITAGACEELLFRGWLVSVLGSATGSEWGAVAMGAAIFGLGHSYQGVRGVLRTAFIGAQLGVLFVVTGSLIPGQLLHAGVDLLAGFVGATVLRKSA